MARTFGAVKDDVLTMMGRDDTDTITIVERAINMSCEIIGIAYRVPEFQLTANGTLSISGNSWNVATSPANFAEVVHVQNTTDGIPCHYIPYDLWEHVVSANEGRVRFYTQHGRVLYFKKTPTVSTNLQMFYTRHHDQISSNSTAIPFDGYDGLVVALTLSISWAALEETETAKLWQEIGGLMGLPAERMAQVRSIVQGTPISPEVGISGSQSARTNA